MLNVMNILSSVELLNLFGLLLFIHAVFLGLNCYQIDCIMYNLWLSMWLGAFEFSQRLPLCVS